MKVYLILCKNSVMYSDTISRIYRWSSLGMLYTTVQAPRNRDSLPFLYLFLLSFGLDWLHPHLVCWPHLVFHPSVSILKSILSLVQLPEILWQRISFYRPICSDSWLSWQMVCWFLPPFCWLPVSIQLTCLLIPLNFFMTHFLSGFCLKSSSMGFFCTATESLSLNAVSRWLMAEIC